MKSKPIGSCSRRKAALAATAVAQALELRVLGKGYGPLKDAAPRNLPADEVIVAVIDALPAAWQWVAGICATYGARPHEALLMASVESNGLVVIRGGKTGARQGLPLPKAWIERWELQVKRLPAINLDRDHRTVGSQLGVALRRYGALLDGAYLPVPALVRQRLDGVTCCAGVRQTPPRPHRGCVACRFSLLWHFGCLLSGLSRAHLLPVA